MNSSEQQPVQAQSFITSSGEKINLRNVALTAVPHITAILMELIMTGNINFRSNNRDKLIIGQLLQSLLDEFKRVQGIDVDERI